MVKVWIHEEDPYLDYERVPEGSAVLSPEPVEVPEELLERYDAAQKAFLDVCEELEGYLKD